MVKPTMADNYIMNITTTPSILKGQQSGQIHFTKGMTFKRHLRPVDWKREDNKKYRIDTVNRCIVNTQK